MVRLGLNFKPLPSSLHLPPLCASVLHITVAVLFAVAAISVVLNIKLNRGRYCYWFVVMVWIIFVNMHASLPFINICLTHPPLNSWFSFLFAMRCTETQSNTSLHNLYPPFCSQFKPEEKTGSSFSVHICKPFAIFGCLLIAFSASNSRPPSFSILSQRCHQSSHCFHFSYDFQTNSLNQIAEFCVHACPGFTLMPFAAWLLFNTFCSCLSWFCSFFLLLLHAVHSEHKGCAGEGGPLLRLSCPLLPRDPKDYPSGPECFYPRSPNLRAFAVCWLHTAASSPASGHCMPPVQPKQQEGLTALDQSSLPSGFSFTHA